MNPKQVLRFLFCFSLIFSAAAFNTNFVTPSFAQEAKPVREAWSKDQAHAWYKKWGWLRGADFIPSTAINQLEMWQKETFDTATINRELTWARSIGMNSMRVYLHHLAWEQDPEGFKNRIDQYLTIAHKHGISTLFVFFDDCWNGKYQPGKQPAPKPGVHNSGWLRDPGDAWYSADGNRSIYTVLEKYVKDVITRFAKDERIVLWDLYNEPGNSGYGSQSMDLLKRVFQWGREVNPTQPLSAGIWEKKLVDLNKYQLENSDVITYHNYADLRTHKNMVDTLRKYGKPLICTEYMARTRNSLLKDILPMLKSENVGAYNWGLVAGKTNTIYAWDNPMPDGKEPEVWFHDIFRKDGTPYREEEIALYRQLAGN